MQNSRLAALLATLSKKEQRDLRKFVATPFFNQRQDVQDLLDLVLEYFNQNQPLPEKEEVYRRLYGPDDPFDDHRVRMAMSFLLKLTEQYLVHAEFFSDEVKVKTRLAEICRRRNLSGHFEKTMREAQAAQEQTSHRNAEFFIGEYHVQMEQYRFSAAANRIARHNLQAVADNLDIAYFSQKLRQACLMLAHQAVYKTDYSFGMLDEVLAYVVTNGLLKIPAIAVYYFSFRALTQPEQSSHFQHLKKLLVEEHHKFPPDEIADLYMLAINFCIKRYNDGDQTYVGDQFDLYREGLEQGYFLNNGVLSRFTYRNIVTAGLKLGEFAWVSGFIHRFQDKIEQRHRESMFCFNLARLEYERRNYGEALRLLQKSEYADLLLNLAAKTLMLKIYFETDELDALESHLAAMRHFIRRKKIMGYHRENYQSLVLFTQRLTEAFDRKSLEMLREEVEAAKAVAEKEWLLARIEDLV